MVKFAPLLFLLTFLSAPTVRADVLTNLQLCSRGVDSTGALFANDLNSSEFSRIIVSTIEGRFGEALRSSIAASLTKRGKTVYYAAADDNSDRLLLQSTINDYSLRYVGIGGGVFRQGKVAREFSISAAGALLASDGRLERTLETRTLMVADTLSFDQARRARGDDTFLAPALPPTTFQRLIEPGVIAGITGVLVYLFFASR
ncbi:MAG: hypothetical protein WBP29_09260 [Candidatus Zixiibacteriota bacterium]